ncbi:MAG: NAD-dependent epimerase/dehydratase family protein [Planctomycetota bacterium]
MATNLYGPGDNYNLELGHVVAALLRRFHDAKESNDQDVTIWGTGKPTRDFMHVDDLADAIIHLLQLDPPDWINAGTGQEVSIGTLAETIARTVGFQGLIRNDVSRPDGTPRKCTDVTRINQLGWKHRIELEQGLELAYESFVSELRSGRLRTSSGSIAD